MLFLPQSFASASISRGFHPFDKCGLRITRNAIDSCSMPCCVSGYLSYIWRSVSTVLSMFFTRSPCPKDYVVQGHRFDIVEDFGCRPTIYVSLASTFIIWVPPLFFSVGSCIFAGLYVGTHTSETSLTSFLTALAFRNFWIRRITFSRHLQTSNSALTTSRYFRLMCMAVVQMFFGMAVTIVNMWFTMRHGLLPWISWENVHVRFSRIAVFPTALIPAQQWTWTYLLWWTIPISSFLFFAFFSFGQDAMKEYRAYFSWVKTHILRMPDPFPSDKIAASLPSL